MFAIQNKNESQKLSKSFDNIRVTVNLEICWLEQSKTNGTLACVWVCVSSFFILQFSIFTL